MTNRQNLYALIIEDGSDQEVRLYHNSESVEAEMLAYLHTHAEPGKLVFRIHPGVSVPNVPLLEFCPFCGGKLPNNPAEKPQS